MRALDYWRDGHGLDNITPAGKQWPESGDAISLIQNMLFAQRIVDFGCGIGRLCELFAPCDYVGVDVCLKAIQIARLKHPQHQFRLIEQFRPIDIDADAILAHTVLLHVPDEDLDRTCRQFGAPVVIISEILGRNWRREGNPPVYNREIADYERAMEAADYRLHRVQFRPYPHYEDVDIAILEFHRK